MSMKDLINKSKVNTNEVGNKQDETVNANTHAKPKPFKLGIGVATTKPVSTDEKPKNPVLNIKQSNSPFAGLKDTLSTVESSPEMSIKNILGTTPVAVTKTPQTNNAEAAQNEVPIQQNRTNTPTLADLDKFVFEEQPDESTEEIAMKFSGMLDSLSTAVGTDIPRVLSDTLLFMKTHSFLATLLKPEEIGELVKTMGRSYGFVANNQTQKSEKKKKKTVEQNQILNSLDMLKF